MTDHTAPFEREATKAAAIVAFVVSSVIAAAWLAAVILQITGQPIIPAPAHGLFPFGIAATIVACFAWARHTTRKKGRN